MSEHGHLQRLVIKIKKMACKLKDAGAEAPLVALPVCSDPERCDAPAAFASDDWEELRDEELVEGDSPPTPDSPGEGTRAERGRLRHGGFFPAAVDGLPVGFSAGLGAMEEEGEVEKMPSFSGSLGSLRSEWMKLRVKMVNMHRDELKDLTSGGVEQSGRPRWESHSLGWRLGAVRTWEDTC
ncbi:hypothetical protein GGX14DRAFT_391049 [Mycena pura]|uniref:Uncharacterized protein n=1 Tax=Mycena pura TaxID=153505 RepID=A0AAD6YEP6_9AGAR|nr:hypothetical protein GGX14DRAFT_391049 [Mycena pura]